jgi:cation diffusion facilitator family transporter
MENKNEILEITNNELEYGDLMDLQSSLQVELNDILDELSSIEEDREKLQNNEYLEEAIQDIIWDQVQNQLAVQIGEEFIKDNNGQKLDLRKEAHIQTAENFEKGNFATHNRDVNYQERYDKWQDNFTTNKKGERVLKKDARKFFDKGRDMGSAAIHKDHTVSIKEQLNDIEMATFFSKEQVKEFANSSKNLHDLDASANKSKNDKTMTEFLNSERNGLKPEERFNIDRKQLEKDDQEAREELKNRKAENENIAIQSGKKSRRKEALKVTGKALKAAVLQLLTEFLREIVKKFISWLGEKEKNFGNFIAKVKEAISNFISNLSHHVLGVGQSMVTMLATSIIGPVVGTFMQVWTFIQQGWRSLTEAIDYLKNPENKNKSTSVKMLEIGKIIVAGVTAAGAIVLSSAIGATLLSIFPPLGVEIPLLGSLSGLIGTFMGATVAGIAGAFVLKLIDQMIVDKQLDELTNKKIDKYNNKLIVQDQMNAVGMALVQVDKMESLSQMEDRHHQAAEIMRDELSFLLEEKEKNDNEFTEIDALLAELTD